MNKRDPKLLFDSSGKPTTLELREGVYYVGRLTAEILEDLGLNDRWGVYVYSQDDKRVVRVGSRPYYTVSRLHAKIIVKSDVTEIIDHGPSGEGSKNGTYVNGEKLHKSEGVAAKRLTDGSWIRLGLRGPLIWYIEGSKLRLNGGVPVAMPSSLVSTASASSFNETAPLGSDEILVVPKPGSSFVLAGGVTAEILGAPNDLVVAETLRRAGNILAEIGLEWDELRREEKIAKLAPLVDLKVFRESFAEAGEELVAKLEYAVEILKRGGDESDAKTLLKQVYYSLKEYLSLRLT